MTLIGRDAELGELRELARHARDGRGRLAVITGDAGIGKSALVEALAAEVGLLFDVTWGRAWELADAPAYYPMWPCLKALGIAVDASQGDTGTFQLWERVLESLVVATARRPVLWIIEDAHVADAQTLDLICFLGQAIRGLPVLLVTTTRPSDDKRVARLARDGREIRLAPLDASALAAIAAQWLGRELQGTEAAGLAERTGGNPLFAIECARAGARFLETVPPTVATIVGARVQALPQSARALVSDAAIIGSEVTAATLALMAGVQPARVIDDVGPALEKGLLQELGPGRYRFSHALVRDAIEAALGAPARIDAHTRADQALATQPDSPRTAIERARHALASIAPGREASTLALVGRALEVLERQGTYDRAAALCAQLHALRADGQLPPATSAELVREGRFALAAGRFTESRALCIEAAALARAQHDVDAFVTAALALAAEIHPSTLDHETTRHLEEARALLGETSSPMRCRVDARLAAALQPAPDPQIPVAMARRAIAEARRTGDRALLEEVMFVGIAAMTEMVDAEELRDLNREHLTLAREVDDPARILRAYVRLVLAEAELGDMAVADSHIEEAIRIANAVGHPRLTWRPYLLASMRAIARGQFGESERYIAEVERAGQLTDDPSLHLALGGHKNLRAVDLHREATVASSQMQLDASLARLPIAPTLIPMLRAFSAARFGNNEAAARELAGFPLDRVMTRHATSVGQLGVLGEVFAAGGSAPQQMQLLERLAPHADRHVFFGHSTLIYGGPMRRVIGLLELALGNRAAGEQQLRRALETARSFGFATWVARISFELGELEGAARLATNLGIRGLARRAQSTHTEPVSPATRPALGIRREGQIWRISYGVRTVRVTDARGMELIAKLVERPGEELHVLVLAGTGGESIADSDAGEALDERAARSYRERLEAIDTELAGAGPERATQLARERDFIGSELARAFGLKNRARRIASASERARVNVQRRIKDALVRIAQQDSIVADYLRGAIRTGTYCTFRPWS